MDGCVGSLLFSQQARAEEAWRIPDSIMTFRNALSNPCSFCSFEFRVATSNLRLEHRVAIPWNSEEPRGTQYVAMSFLQTPPDRPLTSRSSSALLMRWELGLGRTPRTNIPKKRLILRFTQTIHTYSSKMICTDL